MTREELRREPGYIEAHQKIESYKKGLEFTVYYNQMPAPKRRAMEYLLDDCEKEGLIESKAIGVSLELERTDETFVRL